MTSSVRRGLGKALTEHKSEVFESRKQVGIHILDGLHGAFKYSLNVISIQCSVFHLVILMTFHQVVIQLFLIHDKCGFILEQTPSDLWCVID